jgi:NADH:ubiquinone oxidoreductase subunit 5 (subunit L)/multisubunit Na+/H+ antiporter MnhA subunit
LLISKWKTRRQAALAALKALLYNRFGDAALVLSICLIYERHGTLDFGLINLLVQSWMTSCDLLAVLLLTGAAGKSAQLGLHAWLSDAMEGPTPVSALIHAATMVTAGIFLLFRCEAVIANTTWAGSLIAILGSSTALISAASALGQNDIKKIIAFSTCSQLGYIIAGIGLSLGSAVNSGPHLVNHACLKALLFLSAGSLIGGLRNEQDLRKIGGSLRLFRFTGVCLAIASLSLSGMPFISGAFSKDLLIYSATSSFFMSKGSPSAGLSIFLLSLSAGITAFYSMRLAVLAFGSGLTSHIGASTSRRFGNQVNRSWRFALNLPLALLAVLSCCSGLIAYDFGFLSTSFISPGWELEQSPEYLDPSSKLAPVLVS